MVKRIIWSPTAKDDRIEILKYWHIHNGSKAYSQKLNKLFSFTVRLISQNPSLGRPTNFGNARIAIVKDYLILYELAENSLNILKIWDTRRNPEQFKRYKL